MLMGVLQGNSLKDLTTRIGKRLTHKSDLLARENKNNICLGMRGSVLQQHTSLPPSVALIATQPIGEHFIHELTYGFLAPSFIQVRNQLLK